MLFYWILLSLWRERGVDGSAGRGADKVCCAPANLAYYTVGPAPYAPANLAHRGQIAARAVAPVNLAPKGI